MNKVVIMSILIILVIVISLAIYTSNPKEIRVRVTTTTSLYATGLLDYLADEFRKEHPNTFFDFIPVGSGEALRRAENGDAWYLCTHQILRNSILRRML